MLRKICFMAIVLVVLIAIPFEAAADADEVIRIAGDENYPPYEFVDKTGKYKGFNVDIMKAISLDIGVDIEIVPMPWEDAVKALENGEVDAIQGMTRSVMRQERFDFTKALIQNSQAIFVRSETNNISEINNLSGLKVAMQSEDICQEIMKGVPGIELALFKDQGEAMNALLDKRVDAFVGNRLTGLYILQTKKESDKIKIVGEPLCSTEYCSATMKGNQQVLKLLNKGLADIKRNGEYDKIYHKWFGETIKDYSAIWGRLLVIGCIVSVLLIAIILTVFYWNRSLRKLVAERTRELHAEREKLEQSNRFKTKILENILDGIITFDKNGHVLGSNKAAKELFNIESETGFSVEDFRINSNFSYEGYEQALKGNTWKASLKWKTDKNEILNIDYNIYPLKGPGGEVEGIITVLHDYTESKLLFEAKEYDKVKTEFFANMSHEFRTPLSVILAAAQLLELKGKNSSDKELGDAISKTVSSIKQNINRLTRLVNNIIDVTRVDTGFLQLQLKNQNIINVIEEVTMSVVDMVENKGISIQFDTDVEERTIACDTDKIEKIILNLLSNSVKFTPSGGNIFVSVKDGEEYITISVKDTGVGIPKDKQDIIFDRFRQVDKSISRSSEGSGIGLSLVKSLVELHGGTIKVESTYGSGSEFTILLPVVLVVEEPENLGAELVNTVKVETEFSDIY